MYGYDGGEEDRENRESDEAVRELYNQREVKMTRLDSYHLGLRYQCNGKREDGIQGRVTEIPHLLAAAN